MRHLSGTIERGYVYFFYRHKVQIEEVGSLEDIRNLNMLLIPRHPEWIAPVEAPAREAQEQVVGKQEQTEQEMKVLPPGADVVPEHEPFDTTKKHYRMITIGRKHLPTEELMKDIGSRERHFGYCHWIRRRSGSVGERPGREDF
ncbi:hypothetical protein AX15_000776 [Amanita polypyramis BW_CC]|nr:hypothetical protein AX15_000776 [Amanita polypyramis BW_CC]